MRSFVEVGTALLKIKEQQLYREQYQTFSEYCKQRWNMGRAHAYRLIASAKVAEELDGDPVSEGQVRPLTKIKDPDIRKEIWEEARTRFGDKPSASQLQNLLREREAYQTRQSNDHQPAFAPQYPRPWVPWLCKSHTLRDNTSFTAPSPPSSSLSDCLVYVEHNQDLDLDGFLGFCGRLTDWVFLCPYLPAMQQVDEPPQNVFALFDITHQTDATRAETAAYAVRFHCVAVIKPGDSSHIELNVDPFSWLVFEPSPHVTWQTVFKMIVSAVTSNVPVLWVDGLKALPKQYPKLSSFAD